MESATESRLHRSLSIGKRALKARFPGELERCTGETVR